MKRLRETIRVITTGGTFDMSDARSGEVLKPAVPRLLQEARAGCRCVVEQLMRKDSLLMNEMDRQRIVRAVVEAPERRIVVTHGTDTMIETLEALAAASFDKTVVLTGSFRPAISEGSDAPFNLGSAILASLVLWSGTYIVIGGDVFYPGHVEKRQDPRRFAHLAGERKTA